MRGFSNSLKLETEIRCLDVYPTNIKLKTEQLNAMDVESVTSKIYDTFYKTNLDELIIDGRLK